MPITLPSGVQAMIESGSFDAHTTLDIEFVGGEEKHISTVNLDNIDTVAYGTIDYTDNLRVAGSLSQSITISVDRVDLSVQNVDTLLGKNVMDAALSMNGAKGILSTVFVSGATQIPVVILRGQLVNASVASNEVKFQLVSYLSLSGPLGGWRPLMLHCALRYKRAGCDSPDPSPTCSHLFEDPNGCSSKLAAPRIVSIGSLKGNQASIQAFVFRSPVIVGSGIKDPQGAIDGGNDFTSYAKQNNWKGRHTLPSEYYGI